MQPPRPFQGFPYDKDMFTFLPAFGNQDVFVESPRKGKPLAFDSQITIPAPTMSYGSLGNLNPKENAGDLRGKELQCFVPGSSPRKSSAIRNHSDSAKFGNQNDSCAPWQSSFAGQSQSSSYNDSLSLIQSSAGLTYKSPNWSPLVTEDAKQNESHDSNAHVGGEGNDFHFPKSLSYGQQMPTLPKAEGSNSNELALGESQNLQQNVSKPGAYIVGSDGKGFNEHSYQGDSSNLARVEGTKMLGNNVGNSIRNLVETNSILQEALRLLSASSGTGLTINQDGRSQSCGGDVTRITSTPNPQTQNVSHSSFDSTPSKGGEAGLNLDKSIISGDEGSVNLDDGLKSEYGGSSLAEKLWDGTLQLSSSVSVSAVAFFKSGERMQDFSWSGSVEVKGKVRLEAFEKYVQDLPRSRSRGLMVMSLLGKEGSSAASLKNMTEVARKYREGKRVGFAQLNKGVDMYICPHSDAIITILAKHGFFKGMTAVKEKSDPLLGCVVWRKNSTSAPATDAVINASHSGTSPSKQSDGNSEKIQTEIGSGKNNLGNTSLEFCVAPCMDQPEKLMIPEYKMTSVSGNNKQLSEFNSNVESINPNSSNPPELNQSSELSDDEDLPEYDFGAVISQTSESKSSVTVTVSPAPEMEQLIESHVHQPISGQMRSESSTVSRSLLNPRFQGLPQNMKHQTEPQNPSIQAQQEKQRGDFTISSCLSVQGLAPENMGHQPESKIPSWSIEEKKPVDGCTATKKPKNLFDDDDMPEWRPPDFKKIRTEVNERPGPSFGSSNFMISRFSFTDLATGRQLPPPPPLPPLPPPRAVAQVQLLDKDHRTEHQLSLPPPLPPLPPPIVAQVQLLDKNHPTEHQLPLPPPPPPPSRPPPPLSTQGQFFDNNYPPVPHFPKPALNASMHENSDANKNSMHYSSPAPLPHIQFQSKQYPPPPPLPPTPPPPLNQPHYSNNDHLTPHFSKPAVNNFMHNRPVAPSSHVRFQDQRYPPPAPPLPPLVPEKSNANNFRHKNPADVSTQTQFQNNGNSASPARPPADKPETGGSRHEVAQFPPGFTQNNALRPQFHRPGMNNHAHHSNWRSSGS